MNALQKDFDRAVAGETIRSMELKDGTGEV